MKKKSGGAGYVLPMANTIAGENMDASLISLLLEIIVVIGILVRAEASTLYNLELPFSFAGKAAGHLADISSSASVKSLNARTTTSPVTVMGIDSHSEHSNTAQDHLE